MDSEHPTYTKLTEAEAALSAALQLDNLAEGTLSILRPATSVTALARARFLETDADLAADGAMQAVSNAAVLIADSATQYASTRQDNLLPSIRQATEQILVALSNFHYARSAADLDSLAAAAQSFRASLDSSVREIQAKQTEIVRDVDETIKTLKKRVDENRTLLEAANSAQLVRVEELSALTTTERQNLLNLVTDYQSQFSTAQAERASDFSKTKEAQQQKVSELVDEYIKKLAAVDSNLTQEAKGREADFRKDADNLRAEYLESAGAILKKMEESKTQVEDLVGVIGNLGVTSGYLRQANVARRVMWFWQLLALAALAFLITIAVRSFLPTAEGAATFTWQTFASRLSIAVAIGLLAAYAATQGEKASNQERRNRRLALELEAIGPFLAPMKPEEQQKFRYQVGEKSFGVDPEQWSVGSRKNADSATIIGHLLKSKEFRELLETIIKVARP